MLDIGCWDGLFSFECERRGAERVVAADLWENAGRDAFDFAREELGSKVEPLECDVYDLPGKLGGERFDLVLFLGVLYHLRHPLLGLEKVGGVHEARRDDDDRDDHRLRVDAAAAAADGVPSPERDERRPDQLVGPEPGRPGDDAGRAGFAQMRRSSSSGRVTGASTMPRKLLTRK